MSGFVIDALETFESYLRVRMTTMLILLEAELKYNTIYWTLVRCL